MIAPNTRNGGRILVDALKGHGTNRVFCVPGESYLPVLDALHDEGESIQLVVCRQEGGAAFMADAYGKLTGQPGICFVTRGPGATNASIGVHTAYQDSTPMILFVGQVGADMVEREAFQEIDYRRMYGQMAKWVASIDDITRIPEYVRRAFQVATSGRPGPVVLALPENVLNAQAVVEDLPPYNTSRAHAGPNDLHQLTRLLANSSRPLMIVGGNHWSDEAKRNVQAFAERAQIPVATAFRRQDRFNNQHANYAGHMGLGIAPSLAQHVRDSDLLFVLGARLDESTTGGYKLITPSHPGQVMVHVHADPEELGRVYVADLPINADINAFAAQLEQVQIEPREAHREWTKKLSQSYRDDLQLTDSPFAADLAPIVSWLNRRLPSDAIVANGAGNYAAWVHRYFQFSPTRRQLAPTSGAMGYGVPGAVAAKLTHPDRTVVSFNGDGCFMMNGQELATAVQYGAAVIFIVANNSMFGTIRMHQENKYPGRVSGTSLTNPDFAALARAYGAFGETVHLTDDFPGAFERALASGGPALIEVRTDPRAISPRHNLQ